MHHANDDPDEDEHLRERGAVSDIALNGDVDSSAQDSRRTACKDSADHTEMVLYRREMGTCAEMGSHRSS